MERLPIEQTEDTFEGYHERAKALLGNKYDEKRVNGCISLQGPGEIEKIYSELKDSLEQAMSEEEKDSVREEWLEKYDVMKGITR